MAGSLRRGMLVGLLLALAAAPAAGSGPWWGGYCGPSYYYYPYPMYVAPAWTYPMRPLAQPYPAPPSSASTVEPPLHSPAQRAPKVMASRHVGGVAAGQTTEKKP